MIPNEGDNDEGLTEEKPFSPLYPVVNFGNATSNSNHNFLEIKNDRSAHNEKLRDL